MEDGSTCDNLTNQDMANVLAGSKKAEDTVEESSIAQLFGMRQDKVRRDERCCVILKQTNILSIPLPATGYTM